MNKKASDDQYSDQDATRRMNEALRRALTSPPKPHSQMKVGKRKSKTSPRGRPPKNEKGPATEPGPRS